MIRSIIKNIHRWIERKQDNADVYYVVEDANWAVTEVAKDVIGYLRHINAKIVDSSRFVDKNAYIHFGSLNVFYDDKRIKNRKGKGVIVTCFHIVDNDPRKNELKNKDKYVEKWHTSCMITKRKLVSLGIPEEKISIIPIGIDSRNYAPCTEQEKRIRRQQLSIEKDAIVLGYFQKDGNGWGEGNSPKLIKGPDVFCNVVERLAQKYKIHVILSGPARGYVKGRLAEAGFPFSHFVFDEAKQVADLYKIIDLYMVTSREEGGPRAILESMASGIPIISTRVGQAPDIIQNGENGILVDIEDEKALESAFDSIVNSKELRKKLIENGFETVKKYDSEKIAALYENLLYHK